MKSKILILSLVLTLLQISTSVWAASRVEFILDVSGSMNALTGGEKKIDAARNAVAGTVQGIPEGSVVALRFYGHRIPQQDKAKSCLDSQLVIPFGPINKSMFLSSVNQTLPLGQTPIAYSLQQAAKDFGPAKDEEAVIILVSDGEETCGGDPVAVARNLVARGFKIKIHTIGFDVDPTTRAQLMAISQATGGQYQDARNTAALSESLKKVTEESFLIEKKKTIYGEPIRGGDSYETAVPLQSGKLFRLDHHQKSGQFDYFYVDLKGGQNLVATVETGEKGIEIRGAEVTERGQPTAGFEIHTNQRKRIDRSVTTVLGANAKKAFHLSLNAEQGGRYYLLVGVSWGAQHKDNRFIVQVEDLFDAGTQRDAGNHQGGAIEIRPGLYAKNSLRENDKVDFFKFKANQGEIFSIKARPAKDVSLDITVLDSDGVQQEFKRAPNSGAAVKIEGIKPKKDGEIFIKVKNSHVFKPDTDYSLELVQGEIIKPRP